MKYHGWTNDKKLRQPVFLGVQEDRSPRDCTLKDQASPPKAAPAEAASAAEREDPHAADAEPRGVARPKSGPKKTVKRAPGKAAARTKTAKPAGGDSGGGASGTVSGPKKTAAQDLERALADGQEESLAAELHGKALTLTHLNKMYFPERKSRKRDVLLHYLRVAPYMLPFLKDRPLVLKRYPNGIHGEFFFREGSRVASRLDPDGAH